MSSFVAPKRWTANVAFFGPQFVKKQKPATGETQLLQVPKRLVNPSHVQQLVPSIAMGSVATIFMIGGRFVGGGGDGNTAIFTGSETPTAPRESVACAVRLKVPNGALLQTNR